MSVEIELKAWAADPPAVRERLSRVAVYRGAFVKEDTYWRPSRAGGDFPPAGVRLRRETFVRPSGGEEQRLLVTFKTKEVRNGVEVNREREFEVRDAGETPPEICAPGAERVSALEELLALVRLSPAVHKTKRGGVWDYRGITAELLEIPGLGFFLELEIIARDSEDETVREARARLLSLLAAAGIGEDCIETRYYTEMLAGIIELF
ncbi:MAG: hypothetical protein LBC88_00250 [Spirochaetaceae bacterium]|jgi:adenylate cyclase class 2|nr:hypothetical protein [Spirochaetaceae bacterium]